MGAPLAYVVKAPRSSEMAAWLECNDINPRNVPYSSPVFVETLDGEAWFIRFEVYARTDAGSLKYDPVTESFEYLKRSAVMVNDPPMWWLQEVPPTGGGGTSAGPTGAETAAGDDTVAEGAFNCD